MQKPWLQTSIQLEERVQALLREMTLEEKAGQMNQIRNIDTGHRELIVAGKVGSSLFASGAWAGNVRDEGVFLDNMNAMQRVAIEESRLGVPILYARDVIHGHRTVFPIPLAQAATWDPEMVRQAARVAAREAYASGIRWTFTPMMDISRDPRWGRIAESFGEDPFLASKMAAASVKGYQGDDLSEPNRIAACAKHFVGYGGAEGGRDYNTVNMGPRLLRDTYLPPFKAAVDAGLATVMTSFNEIDGIPVTVNRELVTGVLKDEWGFDGFVVTDWNMIGELVKFGVASDLGEAAVRALAAGTDMDMIANAYITLLPELVREGRVAIVAVDDAVSRILRIKMRLGLFERPYTERGASPDTFLNQSDRDLARRMAARSTVLLKNAQNILPLDPASAATLLLTGPMVSCRSELFGTWTLDGRADDVASIKQAILDKVAGTKVKVRAKAMVDEAVLHARYCDYAIVCVGEHPCRSGEANSVSSLDLPPGQLDLLKALHDIGVPLVVVVLAGRPLAIPWIQEHAAAILYAWHPGVEGGRAIADMLFGTLAPQGRLPATMPRNVGQIPLYYGRKPTVKPMDLKLRGSARYCDSADTPLYPFGFGLGYAEFSYDSIRVSPSEIGIDGEVSVSVDIVNTGERPGEEVVQLYVRDPVASVTRPLLELKAFERLALEPGQRKTVTITLAATDLAFTNDRMECVIEPGAFEVMVGPHAQEGLRATFTLT